MTRTGNENATEIEAKPRTIGYGSGPTETWRDGCRDRCTEGRDSSPSLWLELFKTGLVGGVVVCSIAGGLCLITAVEFHQGTGLGVALGCLVAAFASGTATGLVEGDRMRSAFRLRFMDIRSRMIHPHRREISGIARSEGSR